MSWGKSCSCGYVNPALGSSGILSCASGSFSWGISGGCRVSLKQFVYDAFGGWCGSA